MQLAIEHNLTQEELRKAITGMAIGSGIEQEVLDTLLKAKTCDDTPKEPRTRAMRELYAAMQEQFRQAQKDIERYVEAITGIRKSQMAFDFNAPLHLEATTDKTGHVVHRWMADHHSSPEALPVVETPKPQEAAAMTDLKEQLEAYKDKLQAQYIDSVTSTLGWLQRMYGLNLRGKNENVSLRNSKHYKVLENIGGSTYMDTDGNYHIDQAAAADNGREYANATIEAWHDKIMHKVKDLQNSTVHHLDGNRFIISGERDGKKISIEQDMIINRSTNGTVFNQFPARIYVDGKFHSEAAYKKLTGDDTIEKQAKAVKDADKRAKYMLPSGIFAKGDKVKLKLKRGEERYETEGTVLTERNGKTVVRYGANRFNMRDMGIETEKLARWNDK